MNKEDNKAFTEFLICPVCHSDLEINESGNLLCKGCGEEYQIKDGIPIMLPTSTEIIDKKFVELYEKLGGEGKYDHNIEWMWRRESDFFCEHIVIKDKVIINAGGERGYNK